jgi:hypothetical protein
MGLTRILHEFRWALLDYLRVSIIYNGKSGLVRNTKCTAAGLVLKFRGSSLVKLRITVMVGSSVPTF